MVREFHLSERTPEARAAYIEGWNAAIASAARIADEWTQHGHAAVRIRDRIKRLADIYVSSVKDKTSRAS